MSKKAGVPLFEVIITVAVLVGLLVFASREYREARLKADAHILRSSAIRCTTYGTRCIHAYVDYTDFCDSDFHRLEPMGSYEDFNAAFSHVTPEGLKNIPTPEGIIALNVKAMILHDEDLDILHRFPNLQKLDLTATMITDAGLTKIAAFRQLQELSLQQCRVTNKGIAALKDLPELTKLNVAFTDVTADGLVAIDGFNALKHVAMWPRPKPEGDWPFEVEVTRQLADKRGVRRIRRPHRSQPTKLNVRLPEDIAERFPDLTRYRPRMINLQIHWGDFADRDMPAVRHFPFLTMINLGDTEVTDEGLEELRHHFYLSFVTLPKQTTDAGLEHVRRLPMLEHLYLHGTQITDSGLLKLQYATNLRYLDVRGTQVTPEALARLKQIRPHMSISSDVPGKPTR